MASGLAAETLAREVAAGAPLRQAAEAANAAVFARANDSIEHTGMGTTLTALVLEGDEGRLAHVGDSRALPAARRRAAAAHRRPLAGRGDGAARAASRPSEAAVHPHRSILSRALGHRAVRAHRRARRRPGAGRRPAALQRRPVRRRDGRGHP